MALVPMTAPVPIVLGAPVVRVGAYPTLQILYAAANLRALTAGPFTIEIRQAGGGAPLIKAFTFNAPGAQVSEANELDFTIPNDMGWRVDVVSLGIGASDCLVTLWGNVL